MASKDDWCPENDAAYRAELAEAHRHKNEHRLLAEIARLTSEVTQLRADLANAGAVMGKDSDYVLGEPAYRVDATSNYNHESYAERTKLSWLTKSQAEKIAAILNEGVGEGPTFYQARKHGTKLWRGMEEFV